MAVVHRTYSARRETKHFSSSNPSQRVSPLVILQARFQQKQLQEKEEKLLKLYEDQQERALKSVGSRSHSGGSSVSSSSSVGGGKVRHMFQSRRENSEPKLVAPITGRDKSYPLEPLANSPSVRNRFSTSRTPSTWGPTPRSVSLDRHNTVLPDSDENYNRKPIGVRRTQSQVRTTKPRNYYENSNYSFQVVDDDSGYDYNNRFLTNSDNKKYAKSDRNNQVNNNYFQKLESDDPYDVNRNKMEGRYKSYVSQTTFSKKPHLGNGTLSNRTGVVTRQTTEVKESSGYVNGSVSSPVRKIRKPTPVPLSVAPSQHLLQKDIRKPTRIETIKEVPSSKPSTARTQSSIGSFQKPPTPGKTTTTPSRSTPTKSTTQSPATRSAPPSDLVNCKICGRHFAADRVSKHEEVCQKSSRSKRKPFDALQQRVKGTEVEQYIRKSTKTSRVQQEKTAKPQSNWRKKHEEFINNIRAAKEVSAHLKKGGKLSDLPPPPPSDYSDYVPCPHCGRKFNSSAAERHIPKCANIINNKPKPNLQKNAGLKQTSKLLHSASPSVRGRK